MIVDSSALLAILQHEPEAHAFSDLLRLADIARVSAGNFLETSILVERSSDPILSRQFDDLMAIAGIAIEPVTEEQASIGRQAYRDFGRGSGHPAKLNFGDCFAYALAKVSGEPLLFKGNDFVHTDVIPATAQ